MRVRGTFGEHHTAEAPFAAGGSARLFRCHPRGYVYKAYRIPVDDPVEIERLRSIRGTGRRVLLHGAAPMASTPESSVNWPIDTVEDTTPAVAGVVIPEIPARFFTPGGTPRGLDFLILARADPPPARVRLAVLIRLAEIFAWLDTEGLVHGDLSQRNVVWCEVPEPGAYLLDADGIRPNRPRPTIGLATPGWTDPRLAAGLIPAHDHHSDAYALALAMYRGLLLNPGYLERIREGSWPKPAALPPDLDPAVRELLERSLGSPLDPAARATPREWAQVLIDTYVTAGGLDTSKLRVLDDHAQTYRDHHHRQRATPVRPTRPPPRPITPRPAPGSSPPVTKGPSLFAFVLKMVVLMVQGVVGVVLAILLVRVFDDNRSETAGGFRTGDRDGRVHRTAPGSSGDGGPAIEAKLSWPETLVFAAGNLYIADTGNKRVRRVDARGVITTVAGSDEEGSLDDGGAATKARLLAINGLAVDAAGNLYIADLGRIRRVDPAGIITTVVGRDAPRGLPDGRKPATIPGLSPILDGIAVDAAGNLYVLDTDQHRVLRVDSAGIVTIAAGSDDLSFFGSRSLSVGALAVDAAGSIYVAVADTLNFTQGVRKIDAAGTVTTLAKAFSFPNGAPGGLSVDGAGNLYVAEFVPFLEYSVVSRVDPAGVVTRLVSNGPVFPSEHRADISFVHGIAVDAKGNLYIADTGHHRVVRFDPTTGAITTVAGKK